MGSGNMSAKRAQCILRHEPSLFSLDLHRMIKANRKLFVIFTQLLLQRACFGGMGRGMPGKRKTVGNERVSNGLAWCKMVGVVELESTTSTMSTWRSNQLSYTPSSQNENSIYYTIVLRKVKELFRKMRKKTVLRHCRPAKHANKGCLPDRKSGGRCRLREFSADYFCFDRNDLRRKQIRTGGRWRQSPDINAACTSNYYKSELSFYFCA